MHIPPMQTTTSSTKKHTNAKLNHHTNSQPFKRLIRPKIIQEASGNTINTTSQPHRPPNKLQTIQSISPSIPMQNPIIPKYHYNHLITKPTLSSKPQTDIHSMYNFMRAKPIIIKAITRQFNRTSLQDPSRYLRLHINQFKYHTMRHRLATTNTQPKEVHLPKTYTIYQHTKLAECISLCLSDPPYTTIFGYT